MNVQRILVPVDFSEHSQSAALFALWLADNHQATIDMFHIVPPETGDLDVPVVSAHSTLKRVETAREVMKTFRNLIRSRLEELYVPRNEIVIEDEVVVGTTISEIAQHIRKTDPDLVVMGTRGEHNRLDQMFGSVTTGVLNKVDLPVFVIPDNLETLGLHGVCFASDLDSEEPIEIWRAAQLLKPFHPILHIVHVTQSEKDKTGIHFDEMKQFLQGRDMGLKVMFHELKGSDIEDTLYDFVRDRELGLLAFHRRKHGFFQRLLGHSVGRELTLTSNIPLLSV